MGKSNLLLVSLVAAFPAGYLCYEMVMTFLDRADGLETVMLVLAGVTLTGSTVVALSPVGILLFSPSAADIQEQAQGTGAGAAADGMEADGMEADDDAQEVEDDFGDMSDGDEMENDENFEFEDDDDWE
ncbi:MAG: hypothetical protein ABGZ17_09370 [Planctomycetaceae bacterium]